MPTKKNKLAIKRLTATDLSPSERLVIDRRRRGENQEVAARRFQVSDTMYHEWERADFLDETYGIVMPDKSFLPSIGALTKQEICFLLRRRSGKYHRELASKLGCSRYQVLKMERGEAEVDPLWEYWMARAS